MTAATEPPKEGGRTLRAGLGRLGADAGEIAGDRALGDAVFAHRLHRELGRAAGGRGVLLLAVRDPERARGRVQVFERAPDLLQGRREAWTTRRPWATNTSPSDPASGRSASTRSAADRLRILKSSVRRSSARALTDRRTRTTSAARTTKRPSVLSDVLLTIVLLATLVRVRVRTSP
jgi:hypothetical protein